VDRGYQVRDHQAVSGNGKNDPDSDFDLDKEH
jgi:hypothetical protein